MSYVLSGDADNVTTPLAATISGMANNGSGAIRVLTAAPHHYATGDFVHIVTITTVIDTYYSITVIDANHFDLVGSTFTGTGTGTATNVSMTPQFQVPTDGDAFSLQLSGMLSALQALADRTQKLAKDGVQRSMQIAFVTSSSDVVIPPWTTHIMTFGFGGGGGGGGGMGASGTFLSGQFAAGGGGAGSELAFAMFTPLGATRLTVVIGAGGAGGAGSAGVASGTPANATKGAGGVKTTVAYTNGAFAGLTVASFAGGAGGGGGTFSAFAIDTPVYTPGGSGPSGLRDAVSAYGSHRTPSPGRLFDIDNAAGTLSVIIGAAGFPSDWPVDLYTDPVQQKPGDGGASMAPALSASSTYAAGVSYDGAPSKQGRDGGTAGTEGTTVGIHNGGAAGGGGGGGPVGEGADGGNGGNGHATTPTNGTAGGTAGGAGGAGGGGGGGGGAASGAGGNGAAGGAGGSGAVWIVFLTSG